MRESEMDRIELGESIEAKTFVCLLIFLCTDSLKDIDANIAIDLIAIADQVCTPTRSFPCLTTNS